MKKPKHTPIIEVSYASCPCGHFHVTRAESETQGSFTVRAYREFEDHATNPQPDLFSMSELSPIFGSAETF